MITIFKNLMLPKKMFTKSKAILNYWVCYRGYNDCPTSGPQDPNTKITILANGVKVATETMSSPIACVSIFVQAGPRFETACNNGICHMIEHMAYKGLQSMKQREFESTVSIIGGHLSVQTLRECQIFTAKFPVQYAPNIIDIFSRIFMELSFDDEMVEKEKQKIFVEMLDIDSDPKTVTFDYLHQTAFQGTSLAQRVIGPSYTVDKFDASFISSFMKTHYQPFKLVIATAGGLHHDEMVRFAQAKFGRMVGDSNCVSDFGPCRYTGSQITYRNDSMPHAHVAIAVEVPGYRSPEFLTLFLASCTIGSWDRTQGNKSGISLEEASSVSLLCESYESFYIAYGDVGLWGTYFVSKKMDTDDILLNIQDQWMKLCCMPRSSDIERGKCFARLKLAKSVQGVTNSSMDIGTQVMYTGGRKSLRDMFNELDHIKLVNVRNICDKYIYDRCPAVAAVGPTEVLSDYVRIRNGMYWLRL